ncbi:DUF507 family protein [Helicobacter cetorum]|uniref:Competence/damage-inducible domain-containing protein n=1 Tax=Helicobacter cetorum (strain ATCC BAA-429 / MIT 00-7128) TaxID=182217 RepID=I0EK50_HELC0|nr:DUF507 family protein [Helicobacter cetorum]AFI03319.1 hypothetical protein HCW_00090 [Helicobacter cetorum MIT 00-7128]
MRLKPIHVAHVVNKITNEFMRSNLLELRTSQEVFSELVREILDASVKTENAIDEQARELLEENTDEIEFMRMDERQLFWMIKRQIAQKEGFHLSWEDRCNDLSHQILNKILDEDLIMFSVSENLIRNLIYKSIDTYSKMYESIESEVHEKIKHYKRKLPVGSNEYELVFERLYEEELRRKGFL